MGGGDDDGQFGWSSHWPLVLLFTLVISGASVVTVIAFVELIRIVT